MHRKKMMRRFGMLSGAVMLAALVAVGPAFAADRYWDTSTAPGLQGGDARFTNVVWATDAAGTNLTALSSNDNVFFQADTSKNININYSGAGTNFVNNWTVDNANVVSNNPSGSYPLSLQGTLRIQNNSIMYWAGGSSFVFVKRTNDVSIQGNSMNIFDTGSSSKGYDFGTLAFGDGNNVLGCKGNGSIACTFTNISGSSGNVIYLNDNAANSLTINTSADCSYAGIITGVGKFVKNGTGVLTLAGANEYTNTTTITKGTLVLAGENTCGGLTTMSQNSTLIVSNQLALQNSTLELPNIAPVIFGAGITEFTFGGLNKGSQVIGLTNQAGNAITLKVGNNNTDTTYVGLFSGAGNLVKVGSGTFKITNVNSYTGATTIESGTLVFSNRFYLSEYAGAITNNGTLLYQGPSLQNFRGAISGTGTLIHDTPYVLSLYATNTYSGATIVSNGTLKVINTGSLSTNTALMVVGAGSAVNLNVKTQACVSVGGTGFVTNGTLNVTAALYPGGSNSVGTLTLGNLILATGSKVYWDYATGVGDTNKVLGTATLPVSATVQVNASGPLPSRAVLFDCGSLVAPSGVAGWTVTGARPNSRVLIQGNQLLLLSSSGTMISLF